MARLSVVFSVCLLVVVLGIGLPGCSAPPSSGSKVLDKMGDKMSDKMGDKKGKMDDKMSDKMDKMEDKKDK
jgi:hypothetical protein